MRVFIFVCSILSLISSSLCFFDSLKWKSGATKDVDASTELQEVELYINDIDLENVLENKKYLLIYFYSTNCGYCNRFTQDFNYLSLLYNGGNGLEGFQVLKTNAKENPKLSQLFSISQYPTLKIVDFETKQIFTYDRERSIELIITFIEYHTGVEPDYDNFVSPVVKLDDKTFQDFLSSASSSLLTKVIVFTANYIRDWENSHYPQHFYQKFPATHPETEFAIVNVGKDDTYSVQRHFRVANVPSIVKIDTESGTISTFQTNSQNHVTNDRLSFEQLTMFVNGELERDLKSYSGLEDLQNAANEAEDYEIPLGWGLNIIHGKNGEEEQSLEEQYEELMFADEL